ncbi:MAG: CPBP family intramembrane metalloprotease [Verrucomicrobiae bacterium]|nr:CPBP family intramembrane metalloprotease [Verrucomicrobiae bacterium]
MNRLSRLVVWLLVSALAAAVLSPWVYMAVQWLNQHCPSGSLNYLARHPFTRYFNRVFQVFLVSGILAEIFISRREGNGLRMSDFGLAGPPAWKRIAAGAGSSILFMFLYAAATVFFGWHILRPNLSPGAEFGRFIPILATAIGVATAEELFFRGYFLSLCKQRMRFARAVLINVAFFALIHSIRPIKGHILETVDGTSGFRVLGLLLVPFTHPEQMIGGVLVLAAVAVILCWSVQRTGNVYLAIGLHAGWIIALKENFSLTQCQVSWPSWVLGGGDLSQGTLALLPLLCHFLILRAWLHPSK